MNSYNLGFISDADIFQHVKDTVEKYRFVIDLKAFNNHIIAPLKLTFDAKIYGKTIAEVVEAEVLRQLDKSNTNHIGYFHQNIFNFIGGGWSVPTEGFDVVHLERQVYAEIKNKHNTMNSASSQKTYIGMQNMLLRSAAATCYLVEVIAVKSQNIAWQISLNKDSFANDRIRRISIDQFYEMATGDALSFHKLCTVLPAVIDDVVETLKQDGMVKNTVLSELEAVNGSSPAALLAAIYKCSFKTYQGF